jgi:Na+/H+-dicarboxylate symporter
MFKKMPVILVLLIASILLLGPYIPLDVQKGIYAVSLTIKSLIVTLLPLIIFGLLFRASVLMARKATWIAGIILIGVCISTFSAVFLARFVGLGIYHMDSAMALPPVVQKLEPLWSFEWESLISNDKVMLAALVLGIGGAFFAPDMALRFSEKLDRFVARILALLMWIIPLFVAGFVFKLQYEGVMGIIIKDYSLVFAAISVAQFAYLFGAYWLLAKGSLTKAMRLIGNMLPASMSGFSTMSSAASLPLMIHGVEKNTTHKQLSRIIVPPLVNIHMVGECFTDVILAYAVLKTYGASDPTLMSYAIFSVYFFLARFSVAAVPGGGIVIVSPLLVKYFGFTDDMVALITTLYMLFDPMSTVGNILGDGAMAQAIDSLVNKFPSLAYSKKEVAAFTDHHPV